jgi:hypothetical protein
MVEMGREIGLTALGTIFIFGIVFAVVTAWYELRDATGRSGRGPLRRMCYVADWSLVLGIFWLALWGFHSEGVLIVKLSTGIVLACWPLPFVYFFTHIRDWSLSKYQQ